MFNFVLSIIFACIFNTQNTIVPKADEFLAPSGSYRPLAVGTYFLDKMKIVYLTRGMCAIVDDEDYEIVNQFTWYANIEGYAHATNCIFEGKRYVSMHRLILRETDPARLIDHINGVKSDNRKQNLRICNSAENAMNARPSSRLKTHLKGVREFNFEGHRLWYAHITIGYQTYGLGFFPYTDEGKFEAASTYDKYAKVFHKRYAYLNNEEKATRKEALRILDMYEDKTPIIRKVYNKSSKGENGFKVCSRCEKTKPTTEFFYQNKAKGIFVSHCKTCYDAKIKEKRALNPKPVKIPKYKKSTSVCSYCKLEKPLSSFSLYINDGKKFAHKNCKECLKIIRRIGIQKASPIPDLPGEEWVDIKGYEGLYRLSNKGRVKSLLKKTMDEREVILKPRKSDIEDYPSVALYKNKNREDIFMHRLMAEYFIPNPENLPVVNHKNANRHDYRIENLEWVTFARNAEHAWEIGRNFGKTKFVPEEIKERMLEYKAKGTPVSKIAELFGIDRQWIDEFLKQNKERLHAIASLAESKFLNNC